MCWLLAAVRGRQQRSEESMGSCMLFAVGQASSQMALVGTGGAVEEGMIM